MRDLSHVYLFPCCTWSKLAINVMATENNRQSMNVCASGEQSIVIFVAQKAENQLQRSLKKKNWKLCAEEDNF